MESRSATMKMAAAALLICGGPLLAGKQVRPEQAPTFRTGIEVVSIDVGVIDKQGHPLRGLGPGDFTVSVGGHPRRVVSAEFVDVAPPAQPGAAAVPDAVAVSTNEGGGVGRLFVFIVDQGTLDPGSARNVARAASRFFPRLTFSDRSALMLMPVGEGVGFTWAHDRVRAALQRVSGMSSPMSSFEFGSLTDARDIANRNGFALRSLAERECRSSPFAGGGGLGGPAGSAPVGGAAPGPSGPAGGGTPSGGGAGGTGTPAGGGGAGGGGGETTGSTPRTPRGSNTGGSLGSDACVSNLQMQAESTWRVAEMTSMSSLSSLRQMLASLGRVRGDKTVILISGGWPMDEREETSVMGTVAAEAAAARATLYTVFVPASSFSADRRMISSAPSRDQFLHSGPLETLAGMTGGGTFRAEVNAEAVFDRLGRELAGFYRIGVEKDPSDLDATKARRMKVQVSRGGATVRSREIFDVRTYEDRDWAARLASALDAPIPATAVGLRVTSYLTADPDDATRLKLVIAGEASRLQPGEATFQLVVRDLEGKKILSGEQPLGDATGSVLPFSTSIPLAPGSYIVRLAVMDAAGRVGSVDHRAEARHVALGALAATGPVLVRVPTGADAAPLVALDGVQQDERLALEVALEGISGQAAVPDVVFEIATAGGPALVSMPAALSRGSRDGSIIAQAVTDMRVLPPGSYVARAMVRSGGEALGEVRRAFTVIGAPRVAADASSASLPVSGRTPAAPLTAHSLGTVPRFALDQVLAPKVLGVFLDRVAARSDAASPAMRELLARARTEGPGALVLPAASNTEVPIATFLRGLALLAQKKLDPAANAFRSAMRASPDFYPAMVYLGACYAAGGNDKEAAGAWRTALIREGDAVALHVLLTDALLRQDKGDLALEAVDGARARWPEDEGLKRRFVVASLLSGKRAEGLRAVDELVAKQAEDEPSLALALLVLYDAFVSDQPIEDVEQDRARMIRLADAYRVRGGPAVALVDTWVAAAKKK
jgi:VWFA-related protein